MVHGLKHSYARVFQSTPMMEKLGNAWAVPEFVSYWEPTDDTNSYWVEV